ncbi:hypothetical protein RND81_11G162100 [Saponaria officinalis]|uniref:Cysteine proteinase n=1 Tax=Saponaria officinalis TaxID=3572 RepID=A0AAW1HMX3_SAPOF
MSSPLKNSLFLLLIILSLTLNTISSTPTNNNDNDNNDKLKIYESWLVKYNKQYNVIGEKERRFEIFKENLRFIEEHNNNKSMTYKLGINNFADLTNYEFWSLCLLKGGAKFKGQYDVPQKAVDKKLVKVAIDQDDGREFQFYKSGIFTSNCATTLNHSVVLVGYDTTGDGKDYWIVKNSWGTDWGENGYIRIDQNTISKAGKCGIVATEATYLSQTPNSYNPTYETSVACDSYNSCPSRTTCCCTYTYGPYCLTWGCCPQESAICCDDNSRCCPQEYPVCNTRKGTCSRKKNSRLSIKALERSPPTIVQIFSLAQPF